jgi:hypothetical protein
MQRMRVLQAGQFSVVHVKGCVLGVVVSGSISSRTHVLRNVVQKILISSLMRSHQQHSRILLLLIWNRRDIFDWLDTPSEIMGPELPSHTTRLKQVEGAWPSKSWEKYRAVGKMLVPIV